MYRSARTHRNSTKPGSCAMPGERLSTTAVSALLFWLLMLAAASPAVSLAEPWERLASDDFSADSRSFERLGGNVWKVRDRSMTFGPASDAFAVLTIDELEQVEVRASIVPTGREPRGYATAGVALLADPDHHWRLLLVASPDNKPYFELIERFQGINQAQSATSLPGAKLNGKTEGDLRQWQFGHSYDLKLRLTRESISGEIRDQSSGQFWRRTYWLGRARAVRAGRPALAAAGLVGRFNDLAVDGVRPDPGQVLSVPRGQAGSVAVVEDQAGQLAPLVERWLKPQGFRVQVVRWDELSQKRLVADSADLVVLADARRVPATVARACTSLLRARGKLLAIGAPAFAELLYKTPSGYLPLAQYKDFLYESLTRKSLFLSDRPWKRSARDPKRPGKIEPMPDRPGAWKASVDLDGWDVFLRDVGNGFPDGNRLLCFEARGDEATTQLSIECNEQDGSRWIATVPLSADWRRYLLRPEDFAYWHDAKVRRGEPGDCFRPERATTIRIGLSASHTPKCKAGPHAFWFRDLATAPEVDEQPIAAVPEVEALYPSYKLYPLKSVQTLQPAGASARLQAAGAVRVADRFEAYSAVRREDGQGFNRHRPWRWIRLVDALDGEGRNRGCVLWIMLGSTTMPGAIWGNLGLADPQTLLLDRPDSRLLGQAVVAAAKAMVCGVFLEEAGARHFSYYPDERIELGAAMINRGREPRRVSIRIAVRGADGTKLLSQVRELMLPPGQREPVAFDWQPPAAAKALFPLQVKATLVDPALRGQPGADGPHESLDALTHSVELLPTEPASPEELVTVEGSRFMLNDKPWQLLGMNYRPSNQGGEPTLDMLQRSRYNPEIIEQDLSWMARAGINTLSAIHALRPEDPDVPDAYRDVQDFLNRCRKHGLKVFYFLPWGNPLAGGRVEEVQKHISAAGIKHHPAILGWELSWEPIYHAGSSKRGMDFLAGPWNAWIVERYGSLDEAEQDWDYRLERLGTPGSHPHASGGQSLAAPPAGRCFLEHGPWDRAAAAFRRFFSDYVGQRYGEFIRRLRRFDPNHLITFRFGACGIPSGNRFAHAHSAGVARHVDFVCPEGYDLQPNSPGKPAPDDEIRKGGLITLFYRFLGREKPVVWMEFGYTVQGIHTPWQIGMVHVAPAELENQRQEFQRFFDMFLESGAQGAAPWWLPGGFRLGENSDFGVLEPDGSQRPACDVLKQALPRFAEVPQSSVAAPKGPLGAATPVIDLDLESHYPDAWACYGPQYLAAVRAGRLPLLRTAGTGTTSADCPLTAVGNVACTGRNPPLWLNAEFIRFEIKESPQADWRDVLGSEAISLVKGAQVACRIFLANTAEAAWLAPEDKPADALGRVWLACGNSAGPAVEQPIVAHVPYLCDGSVRQFALPLTETGQQTLSLQLFTLRQTPDGGRLRLPFGQKLVLRVKMAN